MKIAILGATSEIAKDLIRSFSLTGAHDCVLFARRPDAVLRWQAEEHFAKRFPEYNFSAFSETPAIDAIINFVGVGDPAVAAQLGASILDTTATYDELALRYLQRHPACRYLFLSSGAVYGENFDKPAAIGSLAAFPVNSTCTRNWYAIAKFYAEMRHRALTDLSIVDIRVFSYISRHQNLNSRFLTMDIVRAIKNSSVFKTSRNNVTRDYLSPSDFCQLIESILNSPPTNRAVDCFTKAPIDKNSLLEQMKSEFGLMYEFDNEPPPINITGLKTNYYSMNHRAQEFGYLPEKSALEAVIDESREILKEQQK